MVNLYLNIWKVKDCILHSKKSIFTINVKIKYEQYIYLSTKSPIMLYSIIELFFHTVSKTSPILPWITKLAL